MARLSKEDWCRAALLAVGDRGVRAISVEGLARQLGVTKGSFYWHFKNRDALLEAALEYWVHEGTSAVIEQLDVLPSPSARLQALLGIAIRDIGELRAEAALMAAAASDDRIAPMVTAVNARRLAYLTQQYEALGVDDPNAWATVCYAAYTGAVQLASVTPSPIETTGPARLLDVLTSALIPGG